MSYDLHVYAPAGLAGDDLREVVAGVAQLDMGDFDEARGWYSVVRGAKRNYCFTIDGPVVVEAEDVPEEVTAVLLGATHLFQVSVEGSSSADVPYATRFSRRLAQRLGGVVVDQQTDEVWARGAARVAAKPPTNVRINVIDLNWYARSASIGDDFGARYVSLCRRLLPEALPRRFGEFEPLQGKLADAGDDGFARAWRDATSMFFFSASRPCIGGSLWAGPSEPRPRSVWKMGLDLHWQPIADDSRWREALRRFFVAVAEELPAFYASAEVTRGHIWRTRTSWSDGETEWMITPARVNGWMGLPPYPTWWAWYGDAYRSYVDGRLLGGETASHATGLLHRLADAPVDRDTLTRLVTRRRGLRRVAEWVPRALVTTVLPHDARVWTPPLAAATEIPSGLL